MIVTAAGSTWRSLSFINICEKYLCLRRLLMVFPSRGNTKLLAPHSSPWNLSFLGEITGKGCPIVLKCRVDRCSQHAQQTHGLVQHLLPPRVYTLRFGPTQQSTIYVFNSCQVKFPTSHPLVVRAQIACFSGSIDHHPFCLCLISCWLPRNWKRALNRCKCHWKQIRHGSWINRRRFRMNKSIIRAIQFDSWFGQ